MSKLYFLKKSFPKDYFELTARYIASNQSKDGSIPWYKGGETDPWDHVEAAMGLSICGCFEAAEKAYDWLSDVQLENGSWRNAYEKNGLPKEGSHVESNFVAYVATGVWHHFLIAKDGRFLKKMWPSVEAAVEFALNLQTKHGEISWAVDQNDKVMEDALVTGCCSIYKSLECALNIAEVMEKSRPHWLAARNKLGNAIRNRPERFDRTWDSKSRYSMDWFYPALSGVVGGSQARSRLMDRWDEFIVEDLGCRCVSDQPWVTTAESSELTLALIAAGYEQKAFQIFNWLHQYRLKDGSYWTGYVYTQDQYWPEERPTWTAGAILLAADALFKVTPARRLFTSVSLNSVARDNKHLHCAF